MYDKKTRHGALFLCFCLSHHETYNWAAGMTVNHIQFCVFIYIMDNNYGVMKRILHLQT